MEAWKPALQTDSLRDFHQPKVKNYHIMGSPRGGIMVKGLVLTLR